jgi:hypothetical protein
MDPVTAGLALSFGASVVSGIFGGNAQAKQIERQQRAESQAIAAQNLRSIVRNHYMVGMANMQLGLTKRQLAKQGADVKSAGLQAKGLLEANAAASGTIGASADAARADIQMKVDAASQTVKDEWEQTLDNYNNDLESIKQNALNAVIQPRKYEYKNGIGSILLSSALQVGASFGSNYLLQSMRLNLGQTPQTNMGGLVQADYKTNIPNLNYLG